MPLVVPTVVVVVVAVALLVVLAVLVVLVVVVVVVGGLGMSLPEGPRGKVTPEPRRQARVLSQGHLEQSLFRSCCHMCFILSHTFSDFL